MSASATAPATNLTPEKWQQLLEVSDAMAKKATTLEDQGVKQAKAVEDAIPGVVETLVKYGAIDKTQAEDASAILKDHLKTIDLLAKVAAHRPATPNDLGEPVNVEKKQGSSAIDMGSMSPLDTPAARTLFNQSRNWTQPSN